MSRGRGTDRRGRSKGDGRFVQLLNVMLESAAWRSLPASARAVYIEVAKLYNGSNNGRLALSVRDAAARCRVNKDTVSASLRLLEDHGLIECAMPGSFSLKTRHASEWRLTAKRCDRTGVLATHAYRAWDPTHGLDVHVSGIKGPNGHQPPAYGSRFPDRGSSGTSAQSDCRAPPVRQRGTAL